MIEENYDETVDFVDFVNNTMVQLPREVTDGIVFAILAKILNGDETLQDVKNRIDDYLNDEV